MAVRALIIAIEEYANVRGGGIQRKLPGTLSAGLAFRSWLEEKWTSEGRAQGDMELFLLSEPRQPGGRGATRADIVSALQELKVNGQNATEELFFFFSGHGFAFVPKPSEPADVLISSDFESPALSSHCCLKLDEIVAWLRTHLGPGRHFYFVDACRNKLDSTQIQVGPFLAFDPQSTAEAATFVLQSTVRGAVAVVGGAFSETLMSGLKGEGKAKGWDHAVADAMFVRYDALRRFVKEKLKGKQAISSRVDGPDGDGESEAILAKLSPVPQSKCSVQLIDASPDDQGELAIRRGRSPNPEVRPISAPAVSLSLEPDIYSISVRLDGASVDPADAVTVDMYEDQEVVFQKIALVLINAIEVPQEPLAGPQAGVNAVVDVVVPAGAELKLRHVLTGDEQTLSVSHRVSIERGPYVATARGSQGELLKRAEVAFDTDAAMSLDLTGWHGSVPHYSIAGRLPRRNDGVDFSESLGEAITDPDLDLWLALLGGGRIIGSRGDYSKLSQFPLRDFQNEPPGAAPIYIIAGFEDPAMPLSFAVGEFAWQRATRPQNMPGILEGYHGAEAGPQFLTFAIGRDPTYTIATAALPNRATLITLTLEENGRPRITQFMLPIGHLIDQLPSKVAGRVRDRNHLKDVRFIAQASRAFRKRRDLSKAIRSNELQELLYAKWLDPIGSSLAAYELIRRGTTDSLAEVVANMTRFFPELPDTWALTRLNGDMNVQPRGAPLFLDGLRAFPQYGELLPFSAGHLDFTSTWTMGRGAVEPPET